MGVALGVTSNMKLSLLTPVDPSGSDRPNLTGSGMGRRSVSPSVARVFSKLSVPCSRGLMSSDRMSSWSADGRSVLILKSNYDSD